MTEALPPTASNTLHLIWNICVVIGVLFAIYFAIIFAFALYNQSPVSIEPYIETTEVPISSLSDTSSISGSFFLGTGSISDNMYFVYYEGNTSYKLKRVDAKYTTVFMDDNETPHLATLEPRERMTFPDGRVTTDHHYWELTTYELHVPKGTLERQYNLNGV